MRTKAGIVPAAAILLLLCADASQCQAASQSLEGYSLKEDPNYSRELEDKEHRDRVRIPLPEFEPVSPPGGTRSQAPPPPSIPQPLSYTRDPGATSIPDVAPYGGTLLGYPPYGEPFWPAWRRDSPRIPWWDWLRFTRRDIHHGPGHHRHR